MSIYDSFADKPNRIREEGQEITLKFSRIDDNTGKVTWNIPPTFKGCKGDGAYDGIVITVSRTPADYIESSPKDGTYYIGDNSVDPDLHAGSKLINSEEEKVLVVGAFYNDKTTTEIEVMDLEPRTAYYFSGYAVDNVARYHREGVHSYSLPTGIEESNEEKLTPAEHVVMLNEDVKLSSATGVEEGKEYTIKADINEEEDVEIKINGNEAKTYSSMIETINRKYMELDNPHYSPTFPFKDTVFEIDYKFYRWDGEKRIQIFPIETDNTPTVALEGDFWYDILSGTLNEYNSGQWVPQTLIKYDFDITNPEDGTIWFDGSVAREWKGDLWCELNTIISSRNPLLPPRLRGNVYWFNTETGEFFERNTELKKWEDALVIHYSKDPEDIDIGDFWFDETNEKVLQLASGFFWEEVEDIKFEETNTTPSNNEDEVEYRYVIDEQTLYEWKATQLEWVPVPIAIFPTDPRDRESCGLWWDSTLSVDNVFLWDNINNIWIIADDFFQQSRDPALPVELEEGSVWYNTSNGELLKILSENCEKVDFIDETFNPVDDTPIGIFWKDGETFKEWNGTMWVELDPQPLQWDRDPTDIEDGTYWLNSNNVLQVWSATTPIGWEEVEVSESDPMPETGFLWYNTVENQLYEWAEEGRWKKTTGMAFVEFVPKKTMEGRALLEFKTRKKGCDAFIEIKARNNTILSALKTNIRYIYPKEGKDLESGVPMYKRLGVGDDGSPDERRELHDKVRQSLGEPSTKVELSKSNIDVCIDNALAQLRKYGGISYKRGFFFLDLKPNQQHYVLNDRCTGFNEIVEVKGVFRLRSGFFQGAFSGHDIYGYAALKQLYTLGSFDLLTFHNVSHFIEELETLFATRITYQWVERKRELRLLNAIYHPERVLVDASIERTEQDLIADRGTTLWLQRWAVAEAKMMLSQSRGKFQTLPGPNGSTVLNAQELITQSEAEKAVLMEELEDMAMQGVEEVGLSAYFVLG